MTNLTQLTHQTITRNYCSPEGATLTISINMLD